MDFDTVITLIQESLVFILVFLSLLVYVLIRGNRAIKSLILGLYIALLISIKFPYYELIFSLSSNEGGGPFLPIIVFIVFTILGTLLFERLLEYDDGGSTFDGFHRKILFALAAAVLIMAYSYHILPITALIEPGTPVSTLFAPEANFFWWLIAPLIVLFLI